MAASETGRGGCGQPSRKRRSPTIEPKTPIAAPIPSTRNPMPSASADVTRNVEIRFWAMVPEQVRDDDLERPHQPEREARPDRALHEALGHERHADEPVRRADELHHLDLTTSGEGGQPDRVHDQEQRRREQHDRHRDEGEPDPPGRRQEALDLLSGGDHRVDVGLILVLEMQDLGQLRLGGCDPERLGEVGRSRRLDQRGLVGEVLLEDVVGVLLVQELEALDLRVGLELVVDRLHLLRARVDLHEDLELDAVLPLLGAVVDDAPTRAGSRRTGTAKSRR